MLRWDLIRSSPLVHTKFKADDQRLTQKKWHHFFFTLWFLINSFSYKNIFYLSYFIFRDSYFVFYLYVNLDLYIFEKKTSNRQSMPIMLTLIYTHYTILQMGCVVLQHNPPHPTPHARPAPPSHPHPNPVAPTHLPVPHNWSNCFTARTNDRMYVNHMW